MDDHQDGHDVVEADVYGEPKGHEAENPAGDKALPASPEFVVSWCQVKAKSFYFFSNFVWWGHIRASGWTTFAP